ncbi:hypothetical protein Scinn_15100 [Streptomyces virginiae]|uniref:Glycosyltransferase 2-like domain-containing protein n=1 Tax=Streptomyces virginiae TaxID=1961 RepID=A0ABQ3NGZ9_STRVG|nr:glycosyltransferase [Streptomyces virginiae]GHI12047.1 hypothetical protein Scinn_15100 [Streptomyces virginiae]
MSTVSVVIPCYKYGHFLADCVKSVLDEQEGVDVRVLIIDDASPDDSADVARALAAADPRIEVRVHERNQGHIATYNEGLLEWADGDYVALLSADDRLVPGGPGARRRPARRPSGGRLRLRQAAALPARRSAARGPYPVHRVGGLPRAVVAGPAGSGRAPAASPRPRWSSVPVLQRKVGGYDPELPHAGDIEMWMRLAAHADVGYVQGADQAFYRVHGDNMSTTDFGGQLDDLRQRLVAFDSVLDKCGDLLPGSDLLAVAARTPARPVRAAARLPGPTTGGGPLWCRSTSSWSSRPSACPTATRRWRSTGRCSGVGGSVRA